MMAGLRILLILSSILFFLILIHKIRSSSVRIMDMFYWVFLCILFMLMSLFPDMVIAISRGLGFESPTNFVFLVVIFLLLWKTFSMSIQLSRQNEQMKDTIEQIVIQNKREEDAGKNSVS